MWALELIDSWGKIPSGILWAHIAALGNFDECVNITKTFTELNKPAMKGQYCLARIPVNPKILMSNARHVNHSSFAEATHPGVRMIPTGGVDSIGFRIGICVPDSCTPEYVQEQVQNFITNVTGKNFNKIILIEDDCTTDYQVQFRAIDIFAIVLFSVIGLIILMSTIYDYVMDQIGGTKKQLYISFSILTNGKKLFKMNGSTTASGRSSDVIECLNGIRCLSIVWVVYGHVHMAAFLPMINTVAAFYWLQTFHSMLVQSATVSVDSFFFLSGLLIAWIALKELDKTNGKLNIPLMYLHRYLRLTPIYAISILFSVSIFQYMGSGPFWKITFDKMVIPFCEKHWWSSLLYVQNYVNPSEMCVAHSWYLSVDTQLYIISPLLLIPLWKWGLKFIWVPILLALASISTTFGLYYTHNFPLLFISLNNFIVEQKMEMTYYATHTRISPWIVGLLLGYYFHLNRNKTIKLPKLIVALGWLCSFTIILSIIFGYYGRLPPNPEAPPIEAAFYESCSRCSWSIALAWIVFACHNGYGGIINDFLSLPFWQPFSRLTYSIYITHMFVAVLISASTKTDIYFSTFDFIVRFYSYFGITIVVSVVTVLAFESPILGIEKCIFSKSNSSSKSQTATSVSQDPLCNSTDYGRTKF